jgi:TolB-like protein/Flp pilus assembly protein TadD
VDRCLKKRPEERFSSARDLAFALEAGAHAAQQEPATPPPESRARWLIGAVAVAAALAVTLFLLRSRTAEEGDLAPRSARQIRSIAVLPMDSLSGDGGRDYFADGMTDELITRLAQVGSLDVISRSSVMRYRGTERSVPEIARELGVDAVVEGAVARGEEEVRITVQLIDGRSDRHLWAESYQRPLRDVLTLQSEIARAVAHKIDVALSPDEERRMSAARPVDPEVQEAYFQGMHHLFSFTDEEIRRSIDNFESAIELDPSFALAHLGLGIAYANLSYFGGVVPTETFPRAQAAARKALELDGNQATALAIDGWIAMVYDLDWQRSEENLQQSLDLMPSNADALQIYSYLLSCVGRHDEAIVTARRSLELDPLSALKSQHVGMVLYLARRYDEAIAHLENVIDLHPDYWFAYHRLSMVLGATGRLERAIETIERGIDLAGPDAVRSGKEILGLLLAAAGRREEALAILAEFEAMAEYSYVPPTDIARLHAALGDRDAAFLWLDRAVELRDADLFMTGVWPLWDPIRDDPRFDDLLRRLELTVE